MGAAVLFVDDEESILELAQALFEERSLEIITASSPQQAIELVRKTEIAVMVSDNRMPGMSGIELLTRVRLLSPDTVKILMTGYADLQTAVDAINRVEVFRFVAKPWDSRQMVEVVEDALERYRLIRSLKQGDEANVLSLVHALELKDPYTRGHSERVCEYALKLAGKIGISDLTAIKYGSWLHDCGKIGVSESILHYEGPLDEAELHVVRNHPLWGAEVARQARLSDEVVDIVLTHHERFDGKGYPVGLEGEDISLGARVVAVADVYDALTTDRPYRDAYAADQALEILKSMRATVLDPVLVDAFDEMLQA
ncbi:MAG: Cyclic di-GMP phosphodiesterase response regulator RpfG [Deltaproteobacteria bacterium ADurb.Bin510]|nr:MAG: Cyclic di-GMP phosphodiesterase response regulator RpfG [Deltaproteobacteria bacterium ADurb.Bin510]